MMSFTGLKLHCEDLTQDDSSESEAFFARALNIGLHKVESELGSFYTEDTKVITTTAGTSTYKTPVNFIRLKHAYITVGTTRYPMEEIVDEDIWQGLYRSPRSSNVLTHIFVTTDNFEVFPTPSTSSLNMTLKFESGGKDLVAEDYIDGTITTLANGSTALTATGTTFTSAMAGRYIYLPDGNWYKIATFLTTTTLTLAKSYEGISIAAGSETYKIGQLPIIPGDTHHIPALYAVWQYYKGFKQNTEKALEYEAEYKDELKIAKAKYSRRYSTKYIPGRRTFRVYMNPNNYPNPIT